MVLQQEIVSVDIWNRLTWGTLQFLGVYIRTQPIHCSWVFTLGPSPVLKLQSYFYFFYYSNESESDAWCIHLDPAQCHFVHTSKRESESMEGCQLVTISDSQLVTIPEAIKRTEIISCIVSNNQTVML